MSTLQATSLKVIGTLVCLCATQILAIEFDGGTGEPNDPYRIATAEQLIGMGEDPNFYDQHFILVEDLDLAPYSQGERSLTAR